MAWQARNDGAPPACKRWGVAAVLCCVAACSAGGDGGGAGAPAAATPSFLPGAAPVGEPLESVQSASGRWELSVWTSPQPPRKGTLSVKYRIVDESGAAVDGLTVRVVPWMPAHGHGTSVVSAVTGEGNGWYLVTPVSLYMAGQWELRTAIDGAVSDTAVPVVDVP